MIMSVRALLVGALAASALFSPSLAQAQTTGETQVIACATVSAFCGEIMPASCLQREGAGSLQASAPESCERPFNTYRKCLEMVAKGCQDGALASSDAALIPATLKGSEISCDLPKGQATTFYFDGVRWSRAKGDQMSNPIFVQEDGRLKINNGPDFYYILDRKTGAMEYFFQGEVLKGRCSSAF